MIPTGPLFATFDALFRQTQQPFNRAQKALLQGKTVQFGNNNPFSKKKTLRQWKPNVHQKHIFSEGFGRFVHVKVSSRALRTIHKHGGIENYLLNTRADILGRKGVGMRISLREELKHRPEVAENLKTKWRASSNTVEVEQEGEPRSNRSKSSSSSLRPSLEDARLDRIAAGEALGLDCAATPSQTIEWLKEKNRSTTQSIELEI